MLPLTEESVNVIVPELFSSPPPPYWAELPLMVVSSNFVEPYALNAPPPLPELVLSLTVELVSVVVLFFPVYRPPPSCPAELPLIVQPVSVNWPYRLSRPPPSLAVLPLTVEPLRVTWPPALTRPPPSLAAELPLMVESVTVSVP